MLRRPARVASAMGGLALMAIAAVSGARTTNAIFDMRERLARYERPDHVPFPAGNG